jgi:hypothetical protein
MPCRGCEKRRKAWQKRQFQLSQQGKKHQAALIGAALTVARVVNGRDSEGAEADHLTTETDR